MVVKRTLFIILLTFFSLSSEKGILAQTSLRTTNVLSDGKIYRIAVNQNGVYKISGRWLQENSAESLSQIDISSISVYAIGSGPLQHDSNYEDTERLEALALSINDINSDGLFSSADEILFYAEGPDKNRYDESRGLQVLDKNPFDDKNFVFLKVGGSGGLNEVEEESNQQIISNPTSDYLHSMIYHEDKVNLLDDFVSTQGSGQNWYGEQLTNIPSFDLQDRLTWSHNALRDVRINAVFAGRSKSRESIAVDINDQRYDIDFSPVNTSDIEALYARRVILPIAIDGLSSNDDFSINFSTVDADAQLWIDYISIEGLSEARYDAELLFLNNYINLSSDNTYDGLTISSTEEIRIWDITNPYRAIEKNISAINNKYEIGISPTMPQEFVVFRDDDIIEPLSAELLPSEDILENGKVNLLIISPELFRESAERLRAHRLANDNISSFITTPQKIYDLYSSGRQDPTAIRNYIRDLYRSFSSFEYVILLGDATFDFRHINKEYPNDNFVPTFETFNSLDPLLAFPSDDYYALLDDDENGNLSGDLDISVGRITVRNAAEANAVVNKIISYDQRIDEETIDNWKTQIVFLADDEDNNLHVNDADIIAREVAEEFPLVNQEKIYFDAFRQESTPGGNRYPTATDRLNTIVDQGALIINYLGHGGPNGWAQERVLKIDDINGWNNFDRLPLIVTATCSFTGFDDPSMTTAGEATLLNPSGGALSLFTTVRSVYASKNFQLTRSVFRQMFKKEDGKFLRIGEIMRRAKNDNPSDNSNARKFFLIGDPTIRLSVPPLDITTDRINGVSFGADEETRVSALDQVLLNASVRNTQGEVISDYNGLVDIVIFDKPTETRTIANDNRSFVKSYETQRNVIYRGRTLVENGKINISFTVPVDIDYSIGASKITYYAVSDEYGDAAGFSDQLFIGGNSVNPIVDDQPPVVQAYLNDRTFTNESEVPPSNLVIVDLSDDFGLNLSSTGIGHEITATLDEDSRTTLFLNELLEGRLDDQRSGTLVFNIDDLAVGRHTLTVKAFDVANNVGETTISFIVSDDIEPQIISIENSPNPIDDQTTFLINHDIREDNIDVSMEVYNLSGQLIETLKESAISRDGNIELTWRPYHAKAGTFVCYFTLMADSTGDNPLTAAKKVILLK